MAVNWVSVRGIFPEDAEYALSRNFFNTSSHSLSCIPTALKLEVARQIDVSPEDLDDLSPRPSETPYDFSRWAPLILESRNLAPEDLQTISLNKRQAKYLLDAMNASIPRGRLNVLYADDIEEHIEPLLASLDFRPPHGLWMRLDACSPKDGARRYLTPGALTSVKDIVLQLVTSTRARNAVQNYLLDAEKSQEGSTSSVSDPTPREMLNLYFLPFDNKMRSENEYRVFCSPGDLHIRAISQYQWHQRWKFAEDYSEKRNLTFEHIWNGAQMIHDTIIGSLWDRQAEVSHWSSCDSDMLLRRQGMVFDIVFDEETAQCQLIELNAFGATGNCGSCLFNWVEDWEQLYGLSPEDGKRIKGIFRIVM